MRITKSLQFHTYFVIILKAKNGGHNDELIITNLCAIMVQCRQVE